MARSRKYRKYRRCTRDIAMHFKFASIETVSYREKYRIRIFSIERQRYFKPFYILTLAILCQIYGVLFSPVTNLSYIAKAF